MPIMIMLSILETAIICPNCYKNTLNYGRLIYWMKMYKRICEWKELVANLCHFPQPLSSFHFLQETLCKLMEHHDLKLKIEKKIKMWKILHMKQLSSEWIDRRFIDTDTAPKSIFLGPRISWKVQKDHVIIIFPSTFWLHHRKVQNRNVSVTSKFHLSINFLTQKMTAFPITEKFKTRSFQ